MKRLFDKDSLHETILSYEINDDGNMLRDIIDYGVVHDITYTVFSYMINKDASTYSDQEAECEINRMIINESISRGVDFEVLLKNIGDLKTFNEVRRPCGICGKDVTLTGGHCFGNGTAYYHSDCVLFEYTNNELEELHNNEDQYYTEWEDELSELC